MMQGLISSLTSNVKARYQSCLHSALLQAAIGFCALIACGFFTASGFIYLLQHFTAAEAALLVGGFYLVLSMLLFSFLAIYKEQKKEPPAQPSAALGQEETLLRLFNEISTHGFKPSQLAMLTSLPAFKNISPKYMVAIVLIAGFISGRKMRS